MPNCAKPLQPSLPPPSSLPIHDLKTKRPAPEDSTLHRNLSKIRLGEREVGNPVDYQHPYESMARFAERLALRYDANRTRHAYYRQLRLIHEHFGADPVALSETQLRDYFLMVKLRKRWEPKTIRQARAAARMFFVDQLGHTDWQVFAQIRAKDHHTLPAVLTRQQVHDLLASIRLRRYRMCAAVEKCGGGRSKSAALGM